MLNRVNPNQQVQLQLVVPKKISDFIENDNKSKLPINFMKNRNLTIDEKNFIKLIYTLQYNTELINDEPYSNSDDSDSNYTNSNSDSESVDADTLEDLDEEKKMIINELTLKFEKEKTEKIHLENELSYVCGKLTISEKNFDTITKYYVITAKNFNTILIQYLLIMFIVFTTLALPILYNMFDLKKYINIRFINELFTSLWKHKSV
jgi:hypothetical protein